MKQLEKRKKVKYFLKADKTAKALALLLAVSLLLTATPVLLAAPQVMKQSEEKETITFEYEFPTPEIVSLDDGTAEIQVGDLDPTLLPGMPQLPRLKVVEKLPKNAVNIEVSYDLSTAKTMDVEETIAPGPIPYLLDSEIKNPIITVLAKIVQKLRPNTYIKQSTETEEIEPFNEIYESHVSYGEFFTQLKTLVGMDDDHSTVKYVRFDITPCIFKDVADGTLKYIESVTGKITYTLAPEEPQRFEDEYEFLIITADAYASDLEDFVTHKEAMGLTTKLVTISEIVDETYFDLPDDLRDLQEQIKYFMYLAKQNWNIVYVLAVGGWRTFWGTNDPSVQFPIRYSHNVDGEPGYVVEQYYSCFESTSGFDTWDSNENDRFAEWDMYGYDEYDFATDIAFGRLACRSNKEVKTVVDKIITYETETYGQEWFNTMLSVTGDGFQDIGYATPNDMNWDISALDDGEYTIYSQSWLNVDPDIKGKIDVINVTIDRTVDSIVTFLEDDHLEGKILPIDEDQEDYYPGKPVAEIVVPQEGDILGTTDVGPYVPASAYLGEYWGIVEYNADDQVLVIRVKSYDPSPHALHHDGNWRAGSQCTYRVWIEDDQETEVLNQTKTSSAYWEGEIEGEQAIIYANGGTYQGPMVEDGPFNTTRVWTSNGLFYAMPDVLEAFSEGYGLAYVNGHSSCMVYGDHYPAVPGGRRNGQVNGWAVINLQAGLQRYQASEGDPLFPLSKLTNGEKLPVLLYSGCHSGQFDTSLASVFYDPANVLLGDRYATWTPEGLAWRIIAIPDGGSIATIGNTGLGSGYIGGAILQGLTGWIFPRFFYNYYNMNEQLPKLLGDIHKKTLDDYVLTSSPDGTPAESQNARKHWEQWNLLGDPTLKIGGYDMSAIGERTKDNQDSHLELDQYEKLDNVPLIDIGDITHLLRNEDYLVTDNPGPDCNPEGLVSDGNGNMIVGFTYESTTGEIHPGFAYSSGGAAWKGVIWASPVDCGKPHLYSWEDLNGNTRFMGSCYSGPYWGYINMPDITNPSSWSFEAHWGWLPDTYPGASGSAVTAYTHEGGTDIGGVWSNNNQGVSAFWMGDMTPTWSAGGVGSEYGHFSGDCDQTTGYHFWVFQKSASNIVYVIKAMSLGSFSQKTFSGLHPDVAADDGWTYVVYDNGGSTITCQASSSDGETWDIYTVTTDGSFPRVMITDDGDIECYFVRDTNVYKTTSTDNGENWDTPEKVSDSVVDDTALSPFDVTSEGMVYDGGDGDIYANIFIDTTGTMISEIDVDNPEDGKKVITTITNSGTTELNLDWEISIVGDSPLGDFLGGALGPLVSSLVRALFKGRILLGRSTSGSETLLSGNSTVIESKGVLGIGHVIVTVTASQGDTELAQKSEDGSIFGSKLYLHFPEE